MSSADTGFDIVDPIEGEDLSNASAGDVIEPAQRVRFTIKEAKLRKAESKQKDYMWTSLEPTFVVGPLGVDGQGKYKNKHFFGNQMKFPGLLVHRNKEVKSSDWWVKQAPFQYKQFLLALGLPVNPTPRIDDAFLESLKGREIVADIQLVAIEVEDKSIGKWVKTDEKENILANFKKVD